MDSKLDEEERRTASLEQVGGDSQVPVTLTHLTIFRTATLSEMSWTNSTKYGWNLLRLK